MEARGTTPTRAVTGTGPNIWATSSTTWARPPLLPLPRNPDVKGEEGGGDNRAGGSRAHSKIIEPPKAFVSRLGVLSHYAFANAKDRTPVTDAGSYSAASPPAARSASRPTSEAGGSGM